MDKFKSFLVSEIKSKSNNNFLEIIKEVNLFLKTDEAQITRKKWESFNKTQEPEKILYSLKRIFSNDRA